MMTRRIRAWLLFGLTLWFAPGAMAQRPAPPASNPSPAKEPSAEFLKAADEVLGEMSRLLSLPVKAPLKKSIRSREEIRDYIVRRMKEDKEPAKRYADQKALEKLGLIPKGFALEPFLIDLLTEQIAGLYDPKNQEFFIAEWNNAEDLRVVMAHELTHALQDQNFKIDPWLDAAKPNDDAQTARDAVLEGSAMAAMLDYLLRDGKVTVRDMPDLSKFVREQMGDPEKNTQLAKAPLYLRDELLFPYLAGTTFTQRVLRAFNGWPDFHKVFENPPVSTQQILHPDLYLNSFAPKLVKFPDFSPLLPDTWKKLDENLLGEFGLHELLKQFLGQERAARLSPSWAGDRYAIFEHERTKELLLVLRLRFGSHADASRFFGPYSEALELKYDKRRALFRRPNFFSFDTDEGAVFLRCQGDECLSLEGGTREQFDRLSRAIGWPPGPSGQPMPERENKKVTVTRENIPPSIDRSLRWRTSSAGTLVTGVSVPAARLSGSAKDEECQIICLGRPG